MSQKNRLNLGRAAFFLGIVFSTSCHAHYHGHGGPGFYGPGPYVGPGFYPGWGGPNVIINVPIAPVVPQTPYYVRECDNVEVCNQYDECWLERHCY